MATLPTTHAPMVEVMTLPASKTAPEQHFKNTVCSVPKAAGDKSFCVDRPARPGGLGLEFQCQFLPLVSLNLIG